MKILVVGGGGREHAIITSIAKSSKVTKIYCAPGNAGIAELAECVDIGVMEFDKLVDFAKEKEILKIQTMNEGKPEAIAEKIVEGRIGKFFSEICLLDQQFVKNPDIKVSQLLKEKDAEVVEFARFEKGEGIEKKEENFAEEVMNQVKGN